MLLQFLDQSSHVLVFRHGQSELLGNSKGRCDVSGFPIETDERQRGVAVARMSGEALFENCDRLLNMPCGMQCNRIDVSVSCPIRFKLRRNTQLPDRIVDALEPNQGEPK